MTEPAFPTVFQPFRLGPLTLPHRIVTGAMHLGLETLDDDGAALAEFYAERVRGGAGLVVTGGAAVSRVGAGGADYGVLDDPRFRTRLHRLAGAVHEAGGLVALQLFHAGRYAFEASFGLRPVAPSPVWSRFSRCEPAELTAAQIAATIEDFAAGARFARSAGFDAVEVMGSEGYLVDQFLSPVTNLRDDEWGGDPQRRRRFGLEVLRAVRQAAGPRLAVLFRFTGDDLVPGGTSRTEALEFARHLAAGGADALDLGIGWHEAPVPAVQAVVPAGAWRRVAAEFTAAVAVPVIASTRINRVSLAEDVLAAGEADLVSMARPFLADPDLVANSRAGAPVNVCIACNQACIDRSLVGERVSCLVNPRAGRELEFPRVRAARTLRVAVVGGGPAGLQAARQAALDGHRVTLFEAAPALGGQFRWASRVPAKQDYAATVGFFAAELDRLGVEVRTEHRVGPGEVELLRSADRVLVAAGVRPRVVDVPGSDLPHVLDYPRAFEGFPGCRVVVVIGGGGIAVDLAHTLATAGHEVTVLQRGTRLGSGLGRSSRWAVLAELRRAGVEVVPGVRYEQITAEAVHVRDADGRPRRIPAEVVVVAAGQEPDTTVSDLLTAAGVGHEVIGGAGGAAGLDGVRAFREGLEAAAGLRTPATVAG